MASNMEGNHHVDITVVGSIILDLVTYVDYFPEIGETMNGNKFLLGHGGKGANQCVCAKLLGAQVLLVGKVGKDAFGLDYIEDLKRRQIPTYHVNVTVEATTGIAQIIVSPNGDNTIVVVPEANLLLNEEDVAKASYSIQNSKVLLTQLENNLHTLIYAMKMAQEHHVITLLNTAPIPKNFKLENAIFDHTDIVCANENEASKLAIHPCWTVKDAQVCARIIMKRNPKFQCVIVTMGKLGIVLLDSNDTIEYFPAENVNCVDSTGAGDCFVGALAFYLAKHPHLSMNEMVRRSSIIAADSVTRVGTQSSYASHRDLDSQLFK